MSEQPSESPFRIADLDDPAAEDAGPSAVLLALCRVLDATTNWNKADPEDITFRLDVFHRLEAAIENGARPQDSASAGPAMRIARLFWLKQHPDPQALDALLQGVSDDTPMVRAAALESLTAILDAMSGPADEQTLHQTRRALAIQLHRESVPILAYQLDGLVARLGHQSPPPSLSSNLAPLQTNPYVVGQPVRTAHQFFGREKVIDQMRAALESEDTRAVILHGGRRTGKTSLLYQIGDGVLGPGFLPVYLNLQAQAGEDPQSVLRWITDTVNEGLAAASAPVPPPPQTSPITFGDVEGWLSKVVASIAPTTLLLLLDEYEVLQDTLAAPGVARRFQSLMERQQGLEWVFAGAQKVENLKAKEFLFLLDASRYIKISFLSPEGATRLITEPGAPHLVFEPAAIEAIRELSGGHPFYLQTLCQRAFDLQHGSGMVTPAQVEEVVADLLVTPPPHLILSWNAISLDDRFIGSALAGLLSQSGGPSWVTAEEISAHLVKERFPIARNLASIRGSLAALRESDFVEKKPNTQAFRFTVGLARRWVSEHRSIWDLLDEYRDSARARAAGLWRQKLGWLSDLSLSLLVGVLPAALLGGETATEVTVFFGIVTAYFALSLALMHATPGMRAWHTRLVSKDGLAVRPRRVVRIVLVFLARTVLWWAGFGGLMSWGLTETMADGVWLLVAVLAIEVIDALMIRTSQSDRGLFARLSGTMFLGDTASKEGAA